MTQIRAAEPLDASSLPSKPLSALCPDYVSGFCRQGDQCSRLHLLCEVESTPPKSTSRASPDQRSNVLDATPRRTLHDNVGLESDGPGHLSAYGPRHDNDHVDIQNIQILPTTDEILASRRPYMPEKDQNSHLHAGLARLADLHFRHLRYDNTESLIDVCYHACQCLTAIPTGPEPIIYDDRKQTPRGIQYSLFRDIDIFEISFHAAKGLSFRVSFSCPEGLRGNKMHKSTCLEEGRLAALIGYDDVASEVSSKINSRAASCLLTLADPNDLASARRLLLNSRKVLCERYVLVDFPKVLLPGFSWCLERLKSITQQGCDMPFPELIAPMEHEMQEIDCSPQYGFTSERIFNLDPIRKKTGSPQGERLTLDTSTCFQEGQVLPSILQTIERETTLDQGQAQALCDTLCRRLAFTQGPPGTGKTFLGVALVKTLLASREETDSRPILVVCMTNHALDNFLDDLRSAGLTRFARLGRGSREQWTRLHSILALSRHVQQSAANKKKFSLAKTQLEGLWLEGSSLSNALSSLAANWMAIRSHVHARDPAIFDDLTSVEHVDGAQRLSRIRTARQAGGFAFDYWAHGGDLSDIESLVICFDTMLGKNELRPLKSTSEKASSWEAGRNPRDSLVLQVLDNARRVSETQTSGAWTMSLADRLKKIKGWEEELGPFWIVDQAVEVHRRYQLALTRLEQAREDLDAPLLKQRKVKQHAETEPVLTRSAEDIIGLTTTACAKYWPKLSQLGITTVLCEEAGEVIEAQSLCTLFPSVNHAIFIGDPLQLRAQVSEPEMAMENGVAYRLDQSLFERMMYPSRRDTLPFPASRLNIQRRMHPAIADLMRATLYPGLKDDQTTHKHPVVAGMAERLWWLDHQHPESRPDPRSEYAASYCNEFEVEMVHGLVQYLVNTNEYSFGDIAVLTPYNGQLVALSERLSTTCSIWLSQKDRDTLEQLSALPGNDVDFIDEEKPDSKSTFEMSSMLRLATIDNFQGEEAKIVILSTTVKLKDIRPVPESVELLVIVGTHTYDVQAMDELSSIKSLFNIKPDGVIEFSSVQEVSREATLLQCPTCRTHVDGIRRYSSINKTLDLHRTLADIYFHFGHDLNRLMHRVFLAKSDFKSTRKAFRNQLRSGPLSGKANEYLIKARANMIHGIQADIAFFRDEQHLPFERSMNSLSHSQGFEALANLVRSPLGRASSDQLVSNNSLSQHIGEPTGNGLDEQYSPSESGSESSINGGFFPDNAITRDIVRQIKARDKPPSAWNIPIKSRPFKENIQQFPQLGGSSGDFIATNLPFRLRLDSLFYRCRLLVLEESIHMLEYIKQLGDRTKHSTLLVDGLRAVTIGQAGEIIKDIGKAVVECQSKSLKRLEVEFRLVQISLHSVLRSLNMTSEVNVPASINTAILTCQEYPDTAGIFLSDCLSVKNTVEQGRYNWKMDLYKKEANEFWKSWASQEVGSVGYCTSGHPYSHSTFKDCPECGRQQSAKTVVYSQFLNETAFLAKMQNNKSTTSPTDSDNALSSAKDIDKSSLALTPGASSQEKQPRSGSSGSPLNERDVVSLEEAKQAKSLTETKEKTHSSEVQATSQDNVGLPANIDAGTASEDEQEDLKPTTDIDVLAWGAFFALKSGKVI
ncbi:MAG: hypothetical protein Q9195_004916 [Heterodermia aff. obscurata]